MKERLVVAAHVTAVILVIVSLVLLGREISARSPFALEPSQQAIEMATEALID
ncbi:MAG TPA: hypothetical protein VMT71_04775 [Syntrophorhabdales bacterium]|nr:hypothetical protein [Syntrophorhabdales bacterium]